MPRWSSDAEWGGASQSLGCAPVPCSWFSLHHLEPKSRHERSHDHLVTVKCERNVSFDYALDVGFLFCLTT